MKGRVYFLVKKFDFAAHCEVGPVSKLVRRQGKTLCFIFLNIAFKTFAYCFPFLPARLHEITR